MFLYLHTKDAASIKLIIRENARATVSHEYEVKTLDGVIVSTDKTLIESFK